KKTLLLLALLFSAACATQQSGAPQATPTPAAGAGDQAFKAIHGKYVVEFLRRNPSVNTYLGGAGLDPSLKEADGRLRDHSAAALAEEDRWLADTQKSLEGVDPRSLTPARRIDRDVALAQIAYQLHLHQQRRYQERSLDTYTVEPFRSVDFFIQGMTQTGPATYGTPEEWALVVKRLQDVPRYMKTAYGNLAAGVKSGNTPDWRMLQRDGLDTCDADAKYYEKDFPDLFTKDIVPGPQREDLLRQLADASKAAAGAYRGLHDFIAQTFFDEVKAPGTPLADVRPAVKEQFRGDRFSLGEGEYNWALKNNLRVDKTAAQLYEESWPVVQATQGEMFKLARQIGRQRPGAAQGEQPRRARRPLRARGFSGARLALQDHDPVPRPDRLGALAHARRGRGLFGDVGGLPGRRGLGALRRGARGRAASRRARRFLHARRETLSTSGPTLPRPSRAR